MNTLVNDVLALCLGFVPAPQERVDSAPTAFVEVVKASEPQSLQLRLASDQPANVVETRRVKLDPGGNRLRFDWTRERLDEGTLRFDVKAPARFVAREKVKRLPNMVYLDVATDQAQDATIEVRYLLSGIGWRVDYDAEVIAESDGTESLSLLQTIEIENNSGRELRGAKIAFDGGVLNDVTLKEGEKRRLELARFAKVPLVRRYVFDPSRFGGTPGVEFEIVNSSESGLGRATLPAGKVRVLQRLPGENAPRWIGEDVLPSTAIGEKAKFSPGNARDITVERNVTFQGNENERRDRWNKVVAYDQRTHFHYKVKNGSGKKATVLFVELPGAPFEITTPQSPGDGLEKTKSDRLEKTLTLDPLATVEFDIEWVRRNLF